MADKRMFSRAIVESDAFLDLPIGAQGLYLHLCMNADDEGFIGAPRRAARVCGASEDDLAALIAARFLLSFDSGVVVVKHWYINNYLKQDRFKPTVYTEERATLAVKDNKAYTDNPGRVSEEFRKSFGRVSETNASKTEEFRKQTLPQNSIDKNSIDKNSIDYVIKDKEREERDFTAQKEEQQKRLAKKRTQIRKANELI